MLIRMRNWHNVFFTCPCFPTFMVLPSPLYWPLSLMVQCQLTFQYQTDLCLQSICCLKESPWKASDVNNKWELMETVCSSDRGVKDRYRGQEVWFLDYFGERCQGEIVVKWARSVHEIFWWKCRDKVSSSWTRCNVKNGITLFWW